MNNNDDERYLQYLQRQLQRAGSEAVFVDQKAWFEANRDDLAKQFQSLCGELSARRRGIAQALLDHKEQGPYSDFFATQIFVPLVEEVLLICREGGFAPRLPVRFANSPAFEPSPAALPSTAEHILFAGQGTFSFCNYWSKVFSSAIAEVSSLPRKRRSSPAAAIAKLREGKTLVYATRLALRYALTDSLVGFGKIEQPKEQQSARVHLLNAMEVFIIGHEIGHFLSHEEYPDTHGISPNSDSKSLEFACDSIGLSVSTAYGQRKGNPFAFQLIGPLLFFYALRISDQAKVILLDDEASPQSGSHPTHEERIRFALTFLSEVGAHVKIHNSVKFALDVAMYVGSQVQVALRSIKRSGDSGLA